MHPTTLIDETIQIFRVVQSSLVKGMQNLYAIKESGVWEGRYSSFGEFVEDGLGISQSMASKLLTSHKAWILDANVDPKNLEGIDHEKLYLAAPLLKDQSPQEVLAQVSSLSRSELKQQKNEKQPHAFEPVTICKSCHVREDNHS